MPSCITSTPVLPMGCSSRCTAFQSGYFCASKGSLFHSPGHMFMFGMTTFIFILATIVIVVGTGLTSQGIPLIIKLINPSFVIGWSSHKIDVVVGVISVITRSNPILSDVVCAWRAMVLWRYDRRVVSILSICVLGTLAAYVYDLTLALKTHPGRDGQENIPQGTVAVILVGPMLGTNVLSTSLIAWKAWEYRRTVGAHITKGSLSQRVGKVLALLIESGFIYCLLWMLYLLSAYSVLPGAGTYTVNLLMLFISSMYPAIVIIIVCMQISQDVYNTRPELSNGLDLTTIHFTNAESPFDSSRPTTLSWGGKGSALSPSPVE
ncbi:hypothetical protein F5148DRAFT_738015 [Russula earlei]|uniref:Uncharacterized protein n=1 Tax=Russula earlei TaxID=71964 RepID=A0ACC0TUD3_9AGAM|nr:hypothetical protein F5148DRAFT_738015 [Russula earlei]